MGILGSSAGLLFKIEADASSAKREMAAVDSAVNKLGTNFTDLGSIAGIAAAGVTAIATVAVTASIKLFDLARSASEFGSEIFDAFEKTGLSAETLTTLKFNADNAGSSLEQVSKQTAKFAKLIGEAADGGKEAQASLKALGVTSTDLDVALSQAFKTINDARPGVEQITLAQKAFGKSGADLIPVIKQMSGDLKGATDAARKLGITLTNEDIKAADDFGDSLGMLGTQAKVLSAQFALQFAPEITAAMQSLSRFFANNKDTIRTWGTEFANVIRGLSAAFAPFFSDTAVGFYTMAGNIVKALDLPIIGLTRILDLLEQIGIRSRQQALPGEGRRTEADAIADSMTAANDAEAASLRGGLGSSDSKAKRDRAAQEAQRRAEREANAALRVELNTITNLQKLYNEALDKAVEKLKEFGDIDLFIQETSDATEYFTKRLQDQRAVVEKLEDAKRASNTESENELLTQEQIMRGAQIKIGLLEQEKGIQKELADAYRRLEDDAAKDVELAIKRNSERLDQERERLRIAREMSELAISKLKPGFDAFGNETMQAPGQDGERPGPFEQLISGWKEFYELVTQQGPTLSSTISSIGGILGDAFQGMANAIGNLVEQWVLYGDIGPQMMRRILAQALASIAAEAAVRAIWETALGFAALFLNPAEAAAHFQAAALFGSIAVGSALAGRAVAGDAFKSQTSGAGASSTSGDQSEQNNSFGGFFNGFETRQNRMIAQLTDRTNAVIGAAGEAIDRFNEKFGIASPADVVMAGAGGASAAIFDAHTNELSKGGRGTETLARLTGQYR